jgi:glycine oxidase
MLESSRLWPAFVGGLNGLDGRGATTGYRTTSTLAVGADAADRRALADLRSVQLAAGLNVVPLMLRDARHREPLLSPGISCAFDIPADHQVDPRRLADCILAALADHTPSEATWVAGATDGFRLEASATRLLWDADRVVGAELDTGQSVTAGETVLANGLAAGAIRGLPENLDLPLRPVYGDILRLRVPEGLRPLVTSTVRGMVRGIPVYIVPREDGTVVIGATQREDGLSTGSNAVSAGGVYQLLRDAQVLVPAVAELELIEATARARPGTPDNAPLIGRVGAQDGDIQGLVIATGFFRHGVLLTPVAADIVSGLLDGSADARWARFRPDRFSGQSALSGHRIPTPTIASTEEPA